MEEKNVRANIALEKALVKIQKESSRAARSAFYGAFAKSRLLVPTNGTGESKGHVHLLENSKGELAIPVFTCVEALELWKADSAYAVLGGQELAALSVQIEVNIVLINMAGPGAHGFLTRSELEILTHGRQAGLNLETEEGREIELKIEAPSKTPKAELIKYLQMNLQLQPMVRSAYLFEACYNSGDPHLVLGVQANEKSEETVQRWLQDMVAQVLPHLGPGEYMDFLIIDQELSQKIQETVPPLYWTQ